LLLLAVLSYLLRLPNMAAQFFDRLPVRLTAIEATLREHLVEAAAAAEKLLPSNDEVSLQEWVECRMPGEIELRTDGSGLVLLKPLAKSTKGKGGGKSSSSASAVQAFMSRLPGDSFTQQEEDLRNEIVSALEKSSLSLSAVSKHARIRPAAKALLPDNVPLEEWIERRIGAEVSIDAEGPRTCRLQGANDPPKEKKESKDAFFARLPKDSFLPEEERLRLAIFDFLAAWSNQELATLNSMANDRVVTEAKNALLGKTATNLKEWIERRIGGELRFHDNRRGGHEIHLMDAARPFMAERVARLRHMGPPMGVPMGPPMGAPPGMMYPPPHMMSGPPMVPGPVGRPPHMMGPPMPPRGPERHQERSHRDKDRNAEASNEGATKKFFEKLPTDELLDKELELREALLDGLDRFMAEHPKEEGLALSALGSDKVVKPIKTELLKGQVSLREWIDRRIGGEIQSKMGKNGQVIIKYREGAGPEAESEGADQAVDAEAKSEAFFTSLPPDGFTPEEETLREVLLTWLETFMGSDAPTLIDASANAEIQEAKNMCIPRQSGVSLKSWIDRRIGGEIATWRENGRSEVVSIGMRDQWNEVAVAANAEEEALKKEAQGRKRKAEDQGGNRSASHRNVGNGKGGGGGKGAHPGRR